MKLHNYIFVGNRFNVLRSMLDNGINPTQILAVKDSYLAKELEDQDLNYTLIKDKDHLIKIIKSTDFDILISNGCPHILPVSSIKREHQLFINIHPSFLPDLKGINPINGAILFDKPAGATCHIMDDDIDAGPIISRIKIPLTPDIDLGLLYKLSFMAEQEVFLNALARDFKPDSNIVYDGESSYYTQKYSDQKINFNNDIENIVRQIRAFGILSKQAYFDYKGGNYKVLDAEIVTNPYPISKIGNYKDLEIVFIYENNILIRKGNAFLKLKFVTGNLTKLKTRDILN